MASRSARRPPTACTVRPTSPTSARPPTRTGTRRGTQPAASQEPSATDESGQLLDPDGLVDNTLTVLVGIGGGVVVGVVGTVVLLLATGSGWALLFGLAAWLGSTAYLVRRRTVQAAASRTGYAVAVVLLLVPVVALSPAASIDGGLEERGGLFFLLFVFVLVPAGIAAALGWAASWFIPDDTASDG